MKYTVITKQVDDWWIGWVGEVPGINCQEKTHDELLQSLKLTLKEILVENKKDAVAAAGDVYKEEFIAV